MRYIILTKKVLIISMILIIACITSLFVFAGAGNAISTATSKKQLPIYCTTQSEKIASLSFDAAWGNEDTEQLISILKKYNVKATFFIVGEWVDKYPHSVKALSDAGHEIENHSDNHVHMPSLSKEQMIEEINNCNKKIEKISGKRPTLFRPPYGDYNNAVVDVVKSQGMYCVQWDVDSLDWKDRTADQIADRVIRKTKPGSIILFHNAAKNTPAALPKIIESLQADGYKIVPISKQIHKGDYYIDHEGRQVPKNAIITTSPPSVTTTTKVASTTAVPANVNTTSQINITSQTTTDSSTIFITTTKAKSKAPV